MVTRNDPGLGVFNGDIGIALRPAAADAPLRAHFRDGSGLRSVTVGRLSSVETAFAMTVHKSQGSEFEHAALVLPPEAGRVLTRELVYTGVTRARQCFTLACSRPQTLAAALAQRTRRASGLRELLAGEGGAA
jgi:exodeoxyribonuclease V alpha subunit